MELLPLYQISKTDTVPLPDNDFYIEVPEHRFHLFQPTKTFALDAKDVPVDMLAICISCEDDELDPLTMDLGDFLNEVYQIGLLCQVMDRTESDYNSIIVLRAHSRIYIRELRLTESKKNRVLEVVYDPVPEEILPTEMEVAEEVRKVIDGLKTRSNILEKHVIDRLVKTNSIIRMMNILAYTAISDIDKRLLYLQSEDNIERSALLLRFLIPQFNVEPKQPPKPTLRKKLLESKEPPKTLPIKERLQLLPLPDNVRDKIARDIERIDSIQQSSLEYSLLIDYLTWIADIPWGQYSSKDYELKDLLGEMDKTHFGLQEPKQHLLEHMTIEKITGVSSGTVMCFVGPAGTGKTTLAKTIADVSGRKLIHVALGGMSDEAEFRGHRRTYVASKPGRLISGFKNCGTMDPLILLDEVDKITQYAKGGDPTSALLEILDPEQNKEFQDRYLEVPIDLSRAMFICTANYEENIPDPLKDRMEMIYFKDYSKSERLNILKQYIVPKVLKDYQMEGFSIEFIESTLDRIANKVRVREIEKTVRKLLRMAAVRIVVFGDGSVEINEEFAKDHIMDVKSKLVGFNK